ncbi:hypothetical protein GALL_517550 [mine drainage metagenome]|uniref:Uncharacterized protein n=1 Tax=mine drainage metagenome TaxID=410659 RepID=A0A1J5P554_9ZZZZ
MADGSSGSRYPPEPQLSVGLLAFEVQVPLERNCETSPSSDLLIQLHVASRDGGVWAIDPALRQSGSRVATQLIAAKARQTGAKG